MTDGTAQDAKAARLMGQQRETGILTDLPTEERLLEMAQLMAWGDMPATRREHYLLLAKRRGFPAIPAGFDKMKAKLIETWVKAYSEGSFDAQTRLVLHWLTIAGEAGEEGRG